MPDLTPEAVKAALEGSTPGKWVWGNHTHYGAIEDSCYGDGDWLLSDSGPVIDYAGCGSHRCEVSESDASLIAMAPDLACEYLRLKEENAILRTEKHADAEAIGHLKEVEKAGRRLVGYAEAVIEDGCPMCGGDCSSANPPGYFCPIREAKSDIAAFRALVEQEKE
jgi:hypothetical protein